MMIRLSMSSIVVVIFLFAAIPYLSHFSAEAFTRSFVQNTNFPAFLRSNRYNQLNIAPVIGGVASSRKSSSSKSTFFMVGDLFTDISVTVGGADYHTGSLTSSSSGDKVVDKNGEEFTVGSIVRVSVDGLKAFQINNKGQGWFDENKKFVPDVSESSKKKFLLLPIGLRGSVMKVYDENVVSANLPIQVKFNNGANTEEGYDTPASFLMHFMPNELECV